MVKISSEFTGHENRMATRGHYPRDLFTEVQETALPNVLPSRAFDGETYAPKRDHARLKSQLQRVFELMKDGNWRTLAQISEVVGGSEASVSSRLRDTRKIKYGAHHVSRRHVGSGLYRYKLVLNQGEGNT